MSRLLGSLRPHFRAAFSLGGLFIPVANASTISQLTRDPRKTKYILRTPPTNPAPPREVPTPLVFVSAEGWDKDSSKGMESFASMYAERGYTCLELDIAPPEPAPTTSQALMKHFEDELRAHIRLLAIPFAPVIVARGTGTLISQTYISSNSASGLLLIDPPPSNEALPAECLPTPLAEFDYEPLFPIAILGSPSRLSTLRTSHRLLAPRPAEEAPAPKRNRMLGGMFGRGGRGRWEVQTLEVGEGQEDGQDALAKIEMWLDDIGV